jgi:hypothetical protein
MTNQSEGKRSGIIPGAGLTSALLKGPEIWMNAQVDVLSAMEASMADWSRRRHEAFNAWSRSVQRCLSAETRLISFRPNKIGYATPFGWPFDIRSLAGDAAILTRKMTAGFAKRAGPDDDVPQRRRGRPEVGESWPVEGVAAE